MSNEIKREITLLNALFGSPEKKEEMVREIKIRKNNPTVKRLKEVL